jgi:hypothetical protein
MLIEFLLRAARERPADHACRELAHWLASQERWRDLLAAAQNRLEQEARGVGRVLVEISAADNAWRVTHAWVWPEWKDFPETVPHSGEELCVEIAGLMNEAQIDYAEVHLELLVPEDLLHFERGLLAWENYGDAIDPENNHPIVLRWKDRMRATPREFRYQTGLWQRTAMLVRDRARPFGQAYWVKRGCDIHRFRSDVAAGNAGELIGIPVTSEASTRAEVIRLICNCGLPYACWPRVTPADARSTADSIDRLLPEHHFDDVPAALFHKRRQGDPALNDLLLLWDDPGRNPYDAKFTEVMQRG